jgi:hypothetical protein
MVEIHRRTPSSMMRYFANQVVEIANRSGDVELGGLGMAMNMSADSLGAEQVDDRIGRPLGEKTSKELFAKLKSEVPLTAIPGKPLALVLDVVETEDDYRVYLVGIFPPDVPEPALLPNAVRHRIETFYGAKMDQQVLGLGKEGMQ